MKKFLTLLLVMFFSIGLVLAETDKFSKENLQNKKGFSLTKSITESAVKRTIKSVLKKETGAKFDVNFEGYDAVSIKKGIFKSIELSGKDIKWNDIEIPYVHLKSLSDYNYIDYTQKPIFFKSDMTYAYDVVLSEETINQALSNSKYQKVITRVNKLAGPLFTIKSVRTKIEDNKLNIIMDYNFPVAKSKDKSFVMSSDFKVVDGKIKAQNITLDSAYRNLGINKVANLINLLNPLEFTLDILDGGKHNVNIENINIVDNKVKIDGKILLKGE